jgi:uncharacterized membrane-anchored protein
MKKEAINRVASLGVLFWVIKIFSTTVGETAADYFSVKLNFGLTLTAVIMGAITIGATIWNLKLKKYFPPSYWLLIVMMSIEGTLITDLLVVMGLLFYFWYKKEHTLSIHSINNDDREIFYWLIVLTTFALGTGVGDTVSEHLNFGYLYSLILFSSIFILSGVLNYYKVIDGVLAFWIAFIVTRPIGASLGDLLIQPPKNGGLGISLTTINIIFFIIIISCVLYLTMNQQSSSNKTELNEA